jgi:hypothetical protein
MELLLEGKNAVVYRAAGRVALRCIRLDETVDGEQQFTPHARH